MDTLEDYPLAEAAQTLGLSVQATLSLVTRGVLQGARSEGGWRVARASVAAERARREQERETEQLTTQAERDAATAADAVPADYDEVRALVYRFHVLSIEREVVLRALIADANEAAQRGDPVRERTCRELEGMLRGATYGWEAAASRWRITVDGRSSYPNFATATKTTAGLVS